MNQKAKIRNILFLTAALGAAVVAAAQTTGANATEAAASPPEKSPDVGQGLLGQSYAGLTYTYTDIRDTPVNDQGLQFAYNLPLNAGLDAKFTYEGMRSDRFAGTRNYGQLALANAVAFAPQFGWIRPYVEVGAGWMWSKVLGDHDSSFAGRLGTGTEFQLTHDLSLTPYVDYTHARALAADHRWNYGLKANYWLTDHLGVLGAVDRDNVRSMGYSVGVNFRY